MSGMRFDRKHRVIAVAAALQMRGFDVRGVRDGRECRVVDARGTMVEESGLTQTQAAKAFGITQDYLAAGRLVRLLEDWTSPFPGYFLYYSSRRQMPPTLAALIAVLRRSRSNGTNLLGE